MVHRIVLLWIVYHEYQWPSLSVNKGRTYINAYMTLTLKRESVGTRRSSSGFFPHAALPLVIMDEEALIGAWRYARRRAVGRVWETVRACSALAGREGLVGDLDGEL